MRVKNKGRIEREKKGKKRDDRESRKRGRGLGRSSPPAAVLFFHSPDSAFPTSLHGDRGEA